MLKSKATPDKYVSRVYPYLGKYVGSSDPALPTIRKAKTFIVLFCGPNKGMVVNSQEPDRPIGEYTSEWLEECFVPFDGKVELSN